MARIGSARHPAVVRLQTQERALEVIAFCRESGIQCIAGVEPDQPEDVSDIDRALNPPTPILAKAKVGRNEPCPCGSGKKHKKCCESAVVSGP